MDEKAIVKIGADGSPIKCAKGLDKGCGFKAGAKVCGKCGAMAVEIKDGAAVDTSTPEDGFIPTADTRMEAKSLRLKSLGLTLDEVSEDAFFCAQERKMHPNGGQVCDNCPGGCVSEQNMPSILEVEGAAEAMFDGKTLDSGYSDVADMFVVDVERKDGRVAEAFFDGETGECRGWVLLDDMVISEKDALAEPFTMIGFSDAANIAVKSVEGHAVAVEADIFEGHDAYVVEVDGLDGKSYDVWVALDGNVLAYDEYEVEDAEADGAKEDYAPEVRQEMAKAGEAMADGSFPIKNEADLKNAIQAFGRAKDPKAAKAHIMKRAADLDLEDMIPDGWDSEKSLDTAPGYDGMAKKPAEKSIIEMIDDPELLASLMEFETLELEENLKDLI